MVKYGRELRMEADIRRKVKVKKATKFTKRMKKVSQIRYSLVVIFELNSVPGVQYKDVMMIDNGKYQQE